MKIAMLTDTHWGVRGDSAKFIKNFDDFYTKVFFPRLNKDGIKSIIHLGDMFETRTQININTLKECRRIFLDRLVENGIVMSIIPGNHDVYYRNTNDVNSIDLIAAMYPDSVKVVHEPSVIDFDGFKFGLVPWINKENQERCMKFIADFDGDCLGGHFEIKGAEMTPGNIALDGLSPSLFSHIPCVYSGHFHVLGQYGNIRYISNTSETNWGDVGQWKGFHILDLSTGDHEKVTNPFTMYREIEWCVHAPEPEELAAKYVRIVVNQIPENPFNLEAYRVAIAAHAHEVRIIDNSLKPVTESKAEMKTSSKDIVNGVIDGYGDSLGERIEPTRALFWELYEEIASKMESE